MQLKGYIRMLSTLTWHGTLAMQNTFNNPVTACEQVHLVHSSPPIEEGQAKGSLCRERSSSYTQSLHSALAFDGWKDLSRSATLRIHLLMWGTMRVGCHFGQPELATFAAESFWSPFCLHLLSTHESPCRVRNQLRLLHLSSLYFCWRGLVTNCS